MKKVNLLLSVVICATLLVSCSDFDDLDKRLSKIEEGVGADEPVIATLTTTNYNDEKVVVRGPFIFEENKFYATIYNYGVNEYGVSITRTSNLEFSEGSEFISINFYYDADTKEVEEAQVELQFRDKYGSYRHAQFYSDSDDNSFEITVKSFNAETGAVQISFEGSSTADFEGNAYEGKTMTIKGSFKGKLPVLAAG